MDPSILVLDEPTAGLDPRARRQLIELLQSLPQTMSMSTHDLRFAGEVAARVVVMEAGRIVADGPIQAVLADAALLATHGLEMD